MVSGRSFISLATLSALLLSGSGQAFSSGSGHKTDSKIAKNVLESKGEGYCSPSGPIENTLCAYETIEDLNKRLYPELHGIVESSFFRHWKVDLYRECPFWYENGFCMNRDCGVETAEESHIPEKWRTKALSQVKASDDPNLPPGCDVNSQSFCYIDSESSDSEGQYIDLVLNPERFTGYAGESAHRVWGAIYEENCFGLSEKVAGGLAPAGASRGWEASGKGAGLQGGFGTEVKKTLEAKKEEECLEKRIYYRIISGLHASISIHICADYLDQTTGRWAPNLECFVNRIATNPERLANVYFDTVLVLRAIARAAPYLEAYDIETARSKNDLTGIEADKKVKQQLKAVLEMARESGASAFDEKALFNGDDAIELRDQFKHNFRNVSRILDCTGCDKCRLWGKLQISGIGTALKILFELDDKAFDPKKNPNLLQRSEIVALVNTMHRLSESLYAVETFRKMYADTQKDEQTRLADVDSGNVKPSSKPVRIRKPLKRKAGNNTGGTTKPKALSIASIGEHIKTYVTALKAACTQSLTSCLQQLESGPLRILVEIFGVRTPGNGKEDL